MDSFALELCVALGVVSALTPDWKNDPRQGYTQVAVMSVGLGALLLYVALR